MEQHLWDEINRYCVRFHSSLKDDALFAQTLANACRNLPFVELQELFNRLPENCTLSEKIGVIIRTHSAEHEQEHM